MNLDPVWENGGWTGFPRLTAVLEADLCVVGLGGSGLSAIAAGLELGLSVVGLDGAQVGGGAAGRNGGFFLAGMPHFYHAARANYGADTALSFYQSTLDELDRIFAAGNARCTGSLRIAANDEELADIDQELTALTADGFTVEAYDGAEGAGMLIPWDGVGNPLARVRQQARHVADGGAQLFEHSAAVDIVTGRVTTGLGTVGAGMIVVAVDGRLELIFPELAGTVRTASLQMLATEPEPSVRFVRPVYTDFGHNYFHQLADGTIALGGLRHQYRETSWTTEEGLIGEVQSGLDGILKDLGVQVPVRQRWYGHAAFTEDRRPLFAGMAPGVVAIGAYSGHGNVVGSIYGREAVRQLASGQPITAPL
ncbi:MAG: NAD(P)/FAD-dependent oxidoreductase [Acidimicrobiia bacterium]